MVIKKFLVFGGIILLLLTVFFVDSVNSTPDENKISKEVYDKIKESEDIPVIIKLNQKIQEKMQKEVEGYLKEKNKEFRKYNDLISVNVSKEELKELEKIQAIEKIGYSHEIKAFLQDSVPLINASGVWPIQINSVNITGIDETICFIDTGINFTHPDLIGKNKTCVIDCYNKNCVENCSIGDDNGHGTHVAGIAAASGGINGVGKNISLIGVKALDSNGNGHSTTGETDLTNAIDWCVQNRNEYNISVISMSLGTNVLYSGYCDSDFSFTLTKAINNATRYNISVIASTGNNGNLTSIASPACIQNTTSVGSVRKDDSTIDYNRNAITDLLAPGISINSTSGKCLAGCSCSGNYMVCNGTSMAAPHVAGAFALFRQFFRLKNNRIPTPNEIKNILNSTGKQINDASSGLNFSRIDIYSAINSILKEVSVSLISPANNSFFNIANQNQSFICNATSLNSNLTNMTFYLWNSNSLVYNITQNMAGTNNQTNFSYNFSSEDNYFWNCIAYNDDNFLNSNSNYTFIYDTTKPQINLISPNNSSTWTSSSTVTFSYNVSDVNIANCSLIINNVLNETDTTITENTTQIFSITLGNAVYNWSINCTDSADNINNSELRTLTVSYTATVIQNTGGGGGGGGTATSKTYTITTEQALEGYSQTLSKSDIIKFTFFDEKEGQHILTVDNITDNSISLTIQSPIIKLKLGIGQSAKLNLTSADYYNFYIKLNSIINNKADITIQTIHEQIPKPSVTSNVVKENEERTEEETWEEIPSQKQINITSYIKNILIIMLISAVLFVLFRKSRKKNINRTKTINEYKERLKELKGKK